MCVPHWPPSINFVTQPINRNSLGFETQSKKSSRWFWGPNHQTGAAGFEAQIGKPSTLILRPNQKTLALRLYVHGVDRTRHYLTSRSPGHWVSDLCLTISDPLHQVSYSCHDLHRYPPCHTYHLHITRQANVILHTNKGNIAELWKCPGFKFKHRHANDS
jgi:hypothetical protein